MIAGMVLWPAHDPEQDFAASFGKSRAALSLDSKVSSARPMVSPARNTLFLRCVSPSTTVWRHLNSSGTAQLPQLWPLSRCEGVGTLCGLSAARNQTTHGLHVGFEVGIYSGTRFMATLVRPLIRSGWSAAEITMNRKAWAWAAATLLALGATPGLATNQEPVEEPAVEAAPEALVPVPIAGPFELPWSIGFLPDGSILITEKPGRLSLIRPDEAPKQVQGLPAFLSGSHGGLLDVAVDPDFLTSGVVCLSYTHGAEEASTVRVLRARLDLTTNALVDQQVIFESDPPAPGLEQLGGRLIWAPEGFLFLTLGDRWEPHRAQDLADHAGSIIRIRADGVVPDSNPFVAVPGAKPEIWTYGHRNPQGLARDRQTGQIWSVEHGPQGGDELNLVEGGRNYGWPVISHGLNYDGKPVGIGAASAPGMEQPAHVWVPSVAPSGLTVQRQGEQASLWLGALAGQAVVRLDLRNDGVFGERRFLEGELGRIRDVRQSPDGFLYVITDHPEAWLYRLVPETEQALGAPSITTGEGRSRPDWKGKLKLSPVRWSNRLLRSLGRRPHAVLKRAHKLDRYPL